MVDDRLTKSDSPFSKIIPHIFQYLWSLEIVLMQPFFSLLSVPKNRRKTTSTLYIDYSVCYQKIKGAIDSVSAFVVLSVCASYSAMWSCRELCFINNYKVWEKSFLHFAFHWRRPFVCASRHQILHSVVLLQTLLLMAVKNQLKAGKIVFYLEVSN